MAGNTAVADDQKRTWLWFERNVFQAANPGADSTEIDAALQRRWSELPQDYKNHFLPVLSRVSDAYSQEERAVNEACATGVIDLRSYETGSQAGFDIYFDSYATVDEGIAALKRVQAARKGQIDALQALVQARCAYGKQEFVTPGESHSINRAMVNVEENIAVNDAEIAKWEGDAPQLRQWEAKWREQRRAQGTCDFLLHTFGYLANTYSKARLAA